MAVAHDVTNGYITNAGTVNSRDVTHAAGTPSGVSITIFVVTDTPVAPNTVSYGGVSLTQDYDSGTLATFYRAFVYRSTATPSSGTQTATVSFTTAPAYAFGIIVQTYTGSDATNLFEATTQAVTGTSASPSSNNTITVGTDCKGFDAMFVNNVSGGGPIAPAAGSALGASPYSAGSTQMGSSTQTGTGSKSFAWNTWNGTPRIFNLAWSVKAAATASAGGFGPLIMGERNYLVIN